MLKLHLLELGKHARDRYYDTGMSPERFLYEGCLMLTWTRQEIDRRYELEEGEYIKQLQQNIFYFSKTGFWESVIIMRDSPASFLQH